MLSRAEYLKRKYISSGLRSVGAYREIIGLAWLDALFHGSGLVVNEVGIGVGSDGYVAGSWDPRDPVAKFDFALVRDGVIVALVDVTGTSFTRKESIQRYGRPYVAFLPDKLKAAILAEQRFKIPSYFMLINEAEGEVLLIHYKTVLEHGKLDRFARGEKPYMLTPWNKNLFMKPYRFKKAINQIRVN